MIRVRVCTERSDLADLVSTAIKTTYNTRCLGGVERCVDALKRLKSMSLSVEEIMLSPSISKLDDLRSHRNPKIRRASKQLLDSWSHTLYAEGRDNSKDFGLKNIKKEDERSHSTHEAAKVKKDIRFEELKKKDDEKSETHQTDKIKKNTKIQLLESKKKENLKFSARESVEIKKEAATNLKPQNLKRKGDAFEAVATKKQRVELKNVSANHQKMCSRQNIKAKDVQVTTLQQNAALKKTGQVKESGNPKSEALMSKTTEFVDLFEKAKKAAYLANIKGVLLGKTESSRCVDALSSLMKINITPRPKEPKKIVERLEGLTRHKDRKIANAASSLLNLWKLKIRDSTTKTRKIVM